MPMHFLKTHITGTLSHGHGLALCFLDLMRWPQDTNPTTNALSPTFRHIIKKVRASSRMIFNKMFYIWAWNGLIKLFFSSFVVLFLSLALKRGSLPAVPYLELDNCYRDCKNIHILGFCALLVKAGVFLKAENPYRYIYIQRCQQQYKENKFRGTNWANRYFFLTDFYL